MRFPEVRRLARFRHAFLLTATLALSVGVAVAAEEAAMYVTGGSAVLHAESNGPSAHLEVVPDGAELKVIGHEGRWYKVQTPQGTQGYVSENAVSSTRSGSGSGGGTAVASKLLGGPNASAASDAAAVKGLRPEAIHWAQAHNLHTADADKLANQWNQPVSKEWREFTKEGKVGPDKP